MVSSPQGQLTYVMVIAASLHDGEYESYKSLQVNSPVSTVICSKFPPLDVLFLLRNNVAFTRIGKQIVSTVITQFQLRGLMRENLTSILFTFSQWGLKIYRILCLF